MAKMKVHELAKELEIQSKDVITYLAGNGIEVKAAQSSLEDDAVAMVRKQFGGKTEIAKAESVKEDTVAEKPVVEKEVVETPATEAPKAQEMKTEASVAEAPKKKKNM